MLKLENLSKRYGARLALEAVNLEIKEGEFFALLGPSGSGKTTLLGAIAGIVEPESGKISWRDREITRLAPQNRNASLVFQHYALLPHLNVFENIAFPLVAGNYTRTRGFLSKIPYLAGSLSERLSQEQVHEVLSVLSLVKLEGFDERRVQTLSGGEAQRVALARALVTRPSLLLMDEPLANLDRQLKLELRREIKRIQKATSVTVVYVTHDQEEAVTLADRMALLRAGRLEQAGTAREILSHPASSWVREFFNKESIVNPELIEILK